MAGQNILFEKLRETRSTLRFLAALWQANLLAAMEYRGAFLMMVIGMMLNNAAYFIFWIIFFERFQQVRGWTLTDMFLLFGVTAAGFGAAVFLFGNALNLAELIAKGQLDYYLSLPRPVLLHTLASRSVASGAGDFIYGIMSFFLARQFGVDTILRFVLATVLAIIVFLSFMVIVQSLAFYIGNAQLLGQQALNAMITFSLYPITMFDGTAKLLLFTLIPAAFMGAVPMAFIRAFSWQDFGMLLAAALVLLGLALSLFQRGLKRYESGSAIQTQV